MTADSRTAILRSVWQVVATGGIAAVSVRSVAAAAGVSPGRVQHHFPTKTALLRASVSEMLTLAEMTHRAATSSSDARGELWSLLAHAFHGAETRRSGTSVFYSFVSAGVADPEIARMLADAKSGAEAEAAQLLDRLGVAEPARTARQLLAMADGLVLRVLIGDLDAEAADEAMREALETALGPAPGGSGRVSR